MSRALSRIFIKLNITVYAVNFAVLFVASMLLLSLTGNVMLYMIPGMFFVGIICLVYPDFYNVVGSAFGWQSVTNPKSSLVFEQMGTILRHAFDKDYSGLNQGLPIAAFCFVACWIVGIVGLFMQNKLLVAVSSPMDWYKKRKIRPFVYSVFGLAYSVMLFVGGFAMIGAKSPNPLTGGLKVLAWYFVICAAVILAGIVVILLQRFLTIARFNKLSLAEQNALCEKQARDLTKRQRKRQIKRLKGKARYDHEKWRGKVREYDQPQGDIDADVTTDQIALDDQLPHDDDIAKLIQPTDAKAQTSVDVATKNVILPVVEPVETPIDMASDSSVDSSQEYLPTGDGAEIPIADLPNDVVSQLPPQDDDKKDQGQN